MKVLGGPYMARGMARGMDVAQPVLKGYNFYVKASLNYFKKCSALKKVL